MTPDNTAQAMEKDFRERVLMSFTDYCDHELYSCNALETEPKCGDGCCGGGQIMSDPLECDCGIAKGCDKAIELLVPYLRTLQAERDKLHQDHAWLVEGMQEIAGFSAWPEHESQAKIAKKTLSSLNFPPAK